MKQTTLFETHANPAKRKATASEAPSEVKPAKSFCHWSLNEFIYTSSMTGEMFCTTCKELKKSHRMATIGTTNFRRSTLDRHGDSREHIITTKKKERFYYLLLHLLFLLEVIGPHLDMSIYLFLVAFLVSICTAMCLFEVIYLVVPLAQPLRLIFVSSCLQA